MLRIQYPFDGTNTNEELEDLIDDQMSELGFTMCGDDLGENDSGFLRVLEFEASDGSAAEMNNAEQAFIGSEDQEALQDMVGSILLTFDFEPWDDDGEEEEAEPQQQRSSAYASDKKMEFFGWCTKGTSDKIWGAISAQNQWITFWGARNKKLQFKRADDYASGNSLQTTIREKQRKGYVETTMEAMNALDPDFETRFEEELVLCLLANNFHTNPNG